MAWIGYQVGMTGVPIQDAKRALKAKFSYAKALDDTQVFGTDLQAVLITYQTKKNAAGYKPVLRTDGVLDLATRTALGTYTPPPPPKPAPKFAILTVQGTGVDMWTGYPADLARELGDLVYWQPTGNYPASTFPMNTSVDKGIAELVVQVRALATDKKRNPSGKIVLAGYSQGAIVTAMVWKHHILDPNGSLHDLKDNIVAAITWGNPCRELGKANGNIRVGQPIPDGRGIAPDRIVGTPDWWIDYAHGANGPFGRDLYTDCPNNKTGEDETAIFNIVFSKWFGADTITEQVLEVVTNPFNVISVIKAVINGIGFVAAKPYPTEPHISYDIADAVVYLRSVANSL